jgi:hypothetical protein
MSAAATTTTTTANAASAITPKTDQVRHTSRLTCQCLVTNCTVVVQECAERVVTANLKVLSRHFHRNAGGL